MGGWFRKEIKTVDDLKGLKIRIGGFAGTILRQARRGAAAARRRRHLSGAGEGHDRRRRMGRPLRRREARLLKVAQYYYYPGWWEGCGAGPQLHQHRQVERAAEDLSGSDRDGLGDDLGLGARRNTTTAIRPALKRLVAGGAQLRPFPQDVMEACYKAAQRSLCRACRRPTRLQEDLRQPDGLPQRLVSVVAGRRVRLRQLHDPHAHAHLSGSHRQARTAPERCSGAFLLRRCRYRSAARSRGRRRHRRAVGISISILDGSTPVALSSQ